MIDLPSTERVVQWKNDRLVIISSKAPNDNAARMLTRKLDGSDPQVIAENVIFRGDRGPILPDGKSVAFLRSINPIGGKPPERFLIKKDLPTGEEQIIYGADPKTMLNGFCWSPDGAWFAILFSPPPRLAKGGQWGTSVITTIELISTDGKIHRVLDLPFAFVVSVDWR